MNRLMKRGILLLLALSVLLVCVGCPNGGGNTESTLTTESEHELTKEEWVQRGAQYANEQDYEKAMKCYQTAADMGHVSAWNYIGGLYENGQGVQQDYQKAMKCYQTAAEKGDTRALIYLGSFYQYGKGVAQDYAKALEYYDEAVEKGDESAATYAAALRETMGG